jgi:hypothetical protein
MDDLASWLTTQLDEDERVAREATGLRWGACDKTMPYLISDVDAYRSNRTLDSTIGRVAVAEAPEDRRHIVAQDPARVLREIDAKRQTLAEYNAAGEAMDRAARDGDTAQYNAARAERRVLDRAIRRDAAVHADRPGYLETWRP